ncbi:flagellar filament capping protein FliD [Kineococcus sp. T13]|uniref:flagellar filament capping protein FliD n=1 Tax=Kineococcus vitellinus TaxID=2696565 RepID=UPI0014123810|nr:flagellar filament capping protein FliD [Kineococcus vitellinus]NAZ74708.1 flagellar filament capping protein FliD [Kineococcus vitellinus]
MSTTVSSSTVDGLVSGLDTSSIISKLLAADAAPQTQMKSSVSAAQLKITAYQSVNTKMQALGTAADALVKATGWTPTTASSSSSAVVVTADSTASAGSLSVSVDKLASARSAVSGTFSLGADGKVSDATVGSSIGTPLDIVRSDGSYVTIKPSAGTLDQVVAAVNKAGDLGIKAVAIRVGENSYRLQITSTSTGATAGDFKVVPHGTRPDSLDAAHPKKLSDGSRTETYATVGSEQTGWASLTPAADAQVTLGTGTNAITASSSTNTFTGLMPGVTMTVGATTTSTPASVTVTSNPSAVASAVEALVGAANAALNEITVQSRAGNVGSDGKVVGGGTLRGDSTLRAMKSQVLDAVTAALGGGESAAKYGLQSTKDGALTFDKDVFTKAYQADPATVQKRLAPSSLDPDAAPGVVERLAAVAKNATDADKGSLTTVIAGQNKTISDLTTRIADWNDRLAAKKERYQKYYSSLETALGKLQSQSSWLQGQLASLG